MTASLVISVNLARNLDTMDMNKHTTDFEKMRTTEFKDGLSAGATPLEEEREREREKI